MDLIDILLEDKFVLNHTKQEIARGKDTPENRRKVELLTEKVELIEKFNERNWELTHMLGELYELYEED